MYTALIFVLSAISLLMIVLAVVIMTGKGDGLIAGYNTAREEKREQYNIKQLRAVVAVLILFTLAFVWFVALIDDSAVTMLVGLPVLFFVYLAGIIITNRSRKKK